MFAKDSISLVRFGVTFSSLCLFLVASAPGSAQLSEPKGSKKTAETRLNGKVEEKDKLEHLYRPSNGDPLSKSVKVLSEPSYGTPLQGRTEDITLDSVLKSDNFNLKSLKPKEDMASANAGANLNAMRGMMPSGITWGLGNTWNGWDWNGWGGGAGNGPYYTGNWTASFSFDPVFEQRNVQANMLNTGYNLAPLAAPRGQLLPPDSTNLGWEIAPVRPASPVYEEKNVFWDAWYQKVSNALYHNWLGRGGQPGEATLRITVRRPRQISAELLRTDNSSSAFKKGLMTAVAALNGSTVLDFPSQSLKQAVSFDSVFSAGTDTVAGAFSDRRGEAEHVKLRH